MTAAKGFSNGAGHTLTTATRMTCRARHSLKTVHTPEVRSHVSPLFCCALLLGSGKAQECHT